VAHFFLDLFDHSLLPCSYLNLDDHFAPTRMESLAGMQGLTDFGFSSDEENWMDANEDSWDLTDRQQGAFPSIGDNHIDFGAGYVCVCLSAR
jgi:hypothetical protein